MFFFFFDVLWVLLLQQHLIGCVEHLVEGLQMGGGGREKQVNSQKYVTQHILFGTSSAEWYSGPQGGLEAPGPLYLQAGGAGVWGWWIVLNLPLRNY